MSVFSMNRRSDGPGGSGAPERLNPSGRSATAQVSVQTRYQQSIADLIAKPDGKPAAGAGDTHAGEGGRPRLQLTKGGVTIGSGGHSASAQAAESAAPAPQGSAVGASVLGQRQTGGVQSDAAAAAASAAVRAASALGDDIAYATLRTGVLRVIEDFLASFGKDAAKKSAKELAGLAVGDRAKLRYAIGLIGDRAFKLDTPGERQQLAGLAVALMAGSKKEPAAASDEDVAVALEVSLAKATAAETASETARPFFFTFLEELVRSKGGLPEARLASAAPGLRQLFDEKPALASAADVSSLLDGGGYGAWGDSGDKPATAAPAAPKLPSAESLEDVGDVAARLIGSGLLGAELVTKAREAFAKYSKPDAAGAAVGEILKVRSPAPRPLNPLPIPAPPLFPLAGWRRASLAALCRRLVVSVIDTQLLFRAGAGSGRRQCRFEWF
jgi:hypothetical protein